MSRIEFECTFRHEGQHPLYFKGRWQNDRKRVPANRIHRHFVILALVSCGVFFPACVSEMTPEIRSRMEREQKLRWFAVELSGAKSPEKFVLETADQLARKNNIGLRLVDISNARFEDGECIVLFKTFEMAMHEKTPLLVECSPVFCRADVAYVICSNGSIEQRHATKSQLRELKDGLTPSSARRWMESPGF